MTHFSEHLERIHYGHICKALPSRRAGISADNPASRLARTARNRNIRFGMPSNVKADSTHYVIERPQYVLSYNAKTRTPDWVAWSLSKEDIGKSTRGPFEPDPLLPKYFPHVTSHMFTTAAASTAATCARPRIVPGIKKDMDATFFHDEHRAAIAEQQPCAVGWERLESYCRTLAIGPCAFTFLLRASRCVWRRGGRMVSAEFVGRGRLEVTVPAKIWKVIPSSAA